jgi:hypothetical protein
LRLNALNSLELLLSVINEPTLELSKTPPLKISQGDEPPLMKERRKLSASMMPYFGVLLQTKKSFKFNYFKISQKPEVT